MPSCSNVGEAKNETSRGSEGSKTFLPMKEIFWQFCVSLKKIYNGGEKIGRKMGIPKNTLLRPDLLQQER